MGDHAVPAGGPITAFVFDLDGVILDTETLCVQVAAQVLARHGKALTKEAQRAALGKRPLECWQDVAAAVGLQGVSAQQLVDESEPLLSARWAHAQLLPGALRLLRHLHASGYPIAVATSTPRPTFEKKTANKPELLELLDAVVCGNEVENGKPAPDVFLAAAHAINAAPEECVVVEDAPSGVTGAEAAGMRVVVVPSLVEVSDYPAPDQTRGQGVIQLLPSLLAFDPASLGVPPFSDTICGLTPLEQPLLIKGTVVKGFGRGSRELGIPTANVDADSLRTCLAEAVTGIYAGWASLSDSPTAYKMCMSIGWNPFFENKEKTAEPWILHTFSEPFYGAEIRLVVCAYVRPEANFTSLQALVDRIHLDGKQSEAALSEPALRGYSTHPFLQPSGAATDDSTPRTEGVLVGGAGT